VVVGKYEPVGGEHHAGASRFAALVREARIDVDEALVDRLSDLGAAALFAVDWDPLDEPDEGVVEGTVKLPNPG